MSSALQPAVSPTPPCERMPVAAASAVAVRYAEIDGEPHVICVSHAAEVPRGRPAFPRELARADAGA